MVSRRRTLRLAAGTLAGVAGCLGGESRQSTSTTTRTTPSSTTTATSTTTTTEATETTDTDEPTGLPEWQPAWHRSAAEANVVGLDAAAGTLYVTATDTREATAVEAFDAASGSRRWRARLDGGAVAGSAERGGWGVTVDGARVYAVTGVVDPDEGWTTLHAFDAASGDRAWTLQRERRFEIVGVADGAVYALAHEFEPEVGPEREPPPQPATLYALDAADGSVRWSHRLDRAEGGRVHRGTVHAIVGPEVVAFAPDGTMRWRFAADAEVRRVLPAGDRFAVVALADGDGSTVHGLAADGSAAWSRTMGADRWTSDGERLYAADESVYAIDPDGSVAWRDAARANDLVLGSTGDALYVRTGRAADAIGAYATADGARRWTFDPDAKNAWPEAATADVAACAAMTGTESGASSDTLFAVDADSGDPTASFTVQTAFDVEAFDGRVFVGSGRTDVYAFDA
jgi:outer membrane protein assembly factor BamB